LFTPWPATAVINALAPAHIGTPKTPPASPAPKTRAARPCRAAAGSAVSRMRDTSAAAIVAVPHTWKSRRSGSGSDGRDGARLRADAIGDLGTIPSQRCNVPNAHAPATARHACREVGARIIACCHLPSARAASNGHGACSRRSAAMMDTRVTTATLTSSTLHRCERPMLLVHGFLATPRVVG
jgi:hypothetical protein